MSRSSWSLTVAFGAIAAASLAYAWQQHLQVTEAEAARDALKTELATARSHASSTLKRAAATRAASSSATSAPGDEPPEANNGSGPPGGRQNRGGQFAAFRDSPEAQALMAMERKAALDSRYAGLFKKLNLSPADLEKFKNLLADKQATMMDVLAAARAQGLNPRDNRDEIRALVSNYEAESDANIQATLGPAAYAQYQQYEQTLPQRNVVDQLGQRLSYSSTPLSSDQSEQLISLLAATTPARTNNGGAAPLVPGGGFGGRGGGGAQITDAAIAQSQSILSSTQVDALKQLQQQQAAAAALRQQMRNQTNGTTAATTTPPPKPTGP